MTFAGLIITVTIAPAVTTNTTASKNNTP